MNSEIEGASGCVPVRVHVSDFSFSVDDFPGTFDPSTLRQAQGAQGPSTGSGTAGTRGAVDPGSYNGLKAMTLAFYSADGSEVSKITQEKGSAENFGDFSLTLPLGSYTMVVIGRDVLEGDAFSLTSATVAGYTSERVRETFCAKQSVAITSSGTVGPSTGSGTAGSGTALRRAQGPWALRRAQGPPFDPSTGSGTAGAGDALNCLVD